RAAATVPSERTSAFTSEPPRHSPTPGLSLAWVALRRVEVRRGSVAIEGARAAGDSAAAAAPRGASLRQADPDAVQEHQRARERGHRERNDELDRHASHCVRILPVRGVGPQQALTSAVVKLAPPLTDAVRARLAAVAHPTRLVVVSCSSVSDAERALEE